MQTSKALSPEERQRLYFLLLEAKSRGIKVPDVGVIHTKDEWNVDENGYFVRADGQRYEPSETQRNFLQSKARFSLYYGPRGSGKTGAGAQKALQKIKEGFSGAVLNPDFENFRTSTWPELRQWIPWKMVVPKHRYRQAGSWEAVRPFVIAFTNGAKMWCKGLKDPQAARGGNINWLWYDEAGRDKSGMAWNIAIASVRVGDRPQCWATATPRNMDHWMNKFFIQKILPNEVRELLDQMGTNPDEMIEYFHGTRKDNESHLDPLFYISVMTANPTGWMRQQEVEGNFANEEGALGDRTWFDGHVLDKEPEWADKFVRYWDLAASEKKVGSDPDETVGTLLSTNKLKDKFCIQNQVSGFWKWDKIKENIRITAERDGTGVPIYIEQEPGSGGKNQVAELQTYLKQYGFTVRMHNPRDTGDKVMRANTWFGEASIGQFYMLKGGWNEPFLSQLDTFPAGTHDDRIDSVSGARHAIAPVRKWRKQKFVTVSLDLHGVKRGDNGGNTNETDRAT